MCVNNGSGDDNNDTETGNDSGLKHTVQKTYMSHVRRTNLHVLHLDVERLSVAADAEAEFRGSGLAFPPSPAHLVLAKRFL